MAHSVNSREKIVFFGYAFLNSGGNCEAYVPHRGYKTVVDDQDFIAYCRTGYSGEEDLRGREVFLVSIKNIPKMGERVDSGHIFESGIDLLKINNLRPIGKFGLDEYYRLKGACRLESLNEYEKSLVPSELIKYARKIYLKYLEINPAESLRSQDDLKRLGLDHSDRNTPNTKIKTIHYSPICMTLVSATTVSVIAILVFYIFLPIQKAYS